MATIKSYTDINQSKKLAEILPLESADMYYWLAWSGGVSKEKRNTPKVGTPNKDAIKTYWCPCWGLTALLGVLPDYTLQTNTDGKVFVVCESKKPIISDAYDNPIDACVAMILKLKEMKLL